MLTLLLISVASNLIRKNTQTGLATGHVSSLGKAIAAILKSNTTLVDLDLKQNKLGDAGAEARTLVVMGRIGGGPLLTGPSPSINFK